MPRSRADATKARLVEAGVEAMLAMTATDLVTAQGTRDIAQRAGVSAATFFHHFDSVEAYAAAVLDRIFNPVRPLASDQEIGPHVTEVHASTLPSDASKDLHRSEFSRLGKDPEHRLRVGLWALGGEAGREGYGVYLRERDLPLHALAEQVYSGWGRELRPPVDMPLLVAFQAALLSGAIIRASADPGSIDEESFSKVATALGVYLLRVKGDTRTLDDRIAEVNYFPADRSRSRTGLTARQERSRLALLGAASALFAERGYAGTTVAQISRAAGVSTSTLYELVGGKAGLAVQLLFHRAAEVLGDGAGTPGCGDDPAELLDARLARIYETTALHTDYAAAYAEHLTDPTPLPGRDPIREATVDALAAAQDAGLLRADLAVDDLASIVLSTLVSRVVSPPAEGVAGTTAFLHRYLLAGWS